MHWCDLTMTPTLYARWGGGGEGSGAQGPSEKVVGLMDCRSE